MSRFDGCGRNPTAIRWIMLEWVNAAWRTIGPGPSMIAKSFDACGVTTALDGGAVEARRRTAVLHSALCSEESSDTGFDGFIANDVQTPELYSDTENPFL